MSKRVRADMDEAGFQVCDKTDHSGAPHHHNLDTNIFEPHQYVDCAACKWHAPLWQTQPGFVWDWFRKMHPNRLIHIYESETHCGWTPTNTKEES